MVSALNFYVPIFFVAHLAGAEDTAWFGASHRVVVSLSTFSSLYHFNLYPSIARRLLRSFDDAAQLMSASFRVVAWVSIGGCLTLTLLTSKLLAIAYGETFAAAGPTFSILIWFVPITVLSGHTRWLLVAADKQQYAFFAQIAGAIGTVVVGVPMVAIYGTLGGAMAMIAGSLLIWIAAEFYVLKVLGRFRTASLAIPPAMGALGLYVAVNAADLDPWLGSIGAGIVLLGCAPLVDRSFMSSLRYLAQARFTSS